MPKGAHWAGSGETAIVAGPCADPNEMKGVTWFRRVDKVYVRVSRLVGWPRKKPTTQLAAEDKILSGDFGRKSPVAVAA